MDSVFRYFGCVCVVQTGDAITSPDCSSRVTCEQPLQPRVQALQCGEHAQCAVRDGVRDCYCDDGFERDDSDVCEGASTEKELTSSNLSHHVHVSM